MASDPVQNTLVRYASELLDKASKKLADEIEKATNGALPYVNVDSKYPGSTRVAYESLKRAVAELSEAEATLASAMRVATLVCKESTPCGPNHMHLPLMR